MVINTENVQVKHGGQGNQQEGHFLQGHSTRSKRDPEKHSCCGGIGAKQETFSGREEAGTEGSSLSRKMILNLSFPCASEEAGPCHQG